MHTLLLLSKKPRVLFSKYVLFALLTLPPALFAAADSTGEAESQTAFISSLPGTFYTPQAISYFSAKGISLPAQKPLSEITNSYHKLLKIAGAGISAKPLLPILISSFPKAIHVTEVKNVRYNGEGTFDDWVYTYVAGEKNKFLLASPLFDYNTMMLLEKCIGSSHEVTRLSGEPVSKPTKEAVNIAVTHTLYPAAYVLAALTGEIHGIEQNRWQEWWNVYGAGFNGSAAGTSGPAPVFGKLQSGQLFSDIVSKGRYELHLATGNVLTGTVESKDDTSLVFECTDGKAYSFKSTLISRFEKLEQPVAATKTVVAASDSLPFSFDELRGKKIGNRTIEVRVNSGMVFRGIVKEINADMMKLDVGGSEIQVSRDVTLNVRIIPNVTASQPVQQKSDAASVKAVQGKKDSVIVKNPTTDDWGVPGQNIIYTGTILDENANAVTMNTDTAGEKSIPRASIVRIVKNSENSYESLIKRYAQALFCPEDMFIVDIPPGKEGRPFFKVCVDRYEFPNAKGAAPKINVSYDEAREQCSKRGKRLCTSDEWQYACSGIEGYTYPYGWNMEKDKCNSDSNRPPEESGNRHNCVSKFGGYDMAGNASEWVTDKRRQPSIVGGPYSKCQTIAEGVGGSAKPQTGFRCCKSN